MKRALRLVLGCVAVILSSFSSCGKAPVACEKDYLAPEAQACPDRESLVNGATYIGQKPQETLALRNGGLKDLTVTSATLSGDSAFTLSTEPATFPATIKGNKNFYLRVVFAPTQAKLYQGKITVESNAQNGSSREFLVTGCGVPADGGTSPCLGAVDAGP